MTEWVLVVGLGNPGREYENTRHNIGWLALDELARRYNVKYDETKKNSILGKATIRGRRVILAKPQTYMNLSGQSIKPLASFYKVPPEHIIVLNDDLDIPLGTLRVRKGGSAAGQKGLANILQQMGTQQIARVRIGIGRPPGRMPVSAYVLQKFSGDDAIVAAQMADRAADAVETWLLNDDLDLTMTHHNRTIEDPRPGVVLAKPKPETKLEPEPTEEPQ